MFLLKEVLCQVTWKGLNKHLVGRVATNWKVHEKSAYTNRGEMGKVENMGP